MSNLEKYEAFFETNSDCLSAAQIDNYVQQKLSKKEKYQFEKHLLNCNFCAEAVEGLLAFEKPINLSQISTQINTQIAEKHFPSSTKTIPLLSYLKVAASVIILVTAGLFVFDKGFPDKENLAFSNEKSTAEESLSVDTQRSDDADLGIALRTNTAEEELKKNKIENTQKADETESKKASKKELFSVKDETKQQQNITLSPTIPRNSEEKKQVRANTQSISAKDVQNDDALHDLAKTRQKSKEKIMLEEEEAVSDDFEAILENDEQPLIDDLGLDEDTNIAFQNNEKPSLEKAKVGGVGLIPKGKQKNDAIQKRQQEKKPSIKALKKQVKKAPDNLNLRYQYALAYFEAGQWNKSLEQLEKILTDSNTTHYHDAIWYKALILIEQGKPTLAKEYLNKLLQNDSYKIQAEQKLQEIE